MDSVACWGFCCFVLNRNRQIPGWRDQIWQLQTRGNFTWMLFVCFWKGCIVLNWGLSISWFTHLLRFHRRNVSYWTVLQTSHHPSHFRGKEREPNPGPVDQLAHKVWSPTGSSPTHLIPVCSVCIHLSVIPSTFVFFEAFPSWQDKQKNYTWVILGDKYLVLSRRTFLFKEHQHLV